MRNFFVRNYIAYGCLIVASFTIAGIVFCFQINQYSMDEKQEQLEKTAVRVSQMTSLLMDNYTVQIDKLYRINVKQLSEDNNTSIILTNSDGEIMLFSDEKGVLQDNVYKINQLIFNRVARYGYYSEMGTMSGMFGEPHYVLGAPCYNSEGEQVATIFVATPTTAVVGLLKQVMQIVLIILSVALILTLIMSYFIADKMTKPLKNMANAAKKFARGDFTIRVPEDNKCDEIDELAISFNNMANSLQQLEELSRGFVANVSHELKTPMTSIGGFVDGMLDGTIPVEKRDKYLEIISDEVKRLSRLIKRMLDAAKIQAGELVINPYPFDICEMSSRIILSFENQINSKNIDVDIDFEDIIMVNGDRDHVFQVVYNLVDNAVKFIDDAGTLSVKAKTLGNYCEFSIKNTGGGISEEDIAHVFDRFYKADKSRSKDKSGAGLGLYIVKTIINLHGGDISVRSGGGETEFSFTLPIAQIK